MSEAAAILRRRECIPVAPAMSIPAAPQAVPVTVVEPAPAVEPAVEPPVVLAELPTEPVAPVQPTKPRRTMTEVYADRKQNHELGRARGIWLREQRAKLGLTQKRLEQLAELTGGKFGELERGRNASPANWARIERVIKDLTAAKEGGGTPF